MTIEPQESTRSAVFAEEAFVVDVQSFLHRLMIEKGFNQKQLADAMGVSKARVSQLFSDECKNFTIRLLARACHALGEEPNVSSRTSALLDLHERLNEEAIVIGKSKNVQKLPTWTVDDWSAPQAYACGDKASERYGRVLVQARDNTVRERAKTVAA